MNGTQYFWCHVHIGTTHDHQSQKEGYSYKLQTVKANKALP